MNPDKSVEIPDDVTPARVYGGVMSAPQRKRLLTLEISVQEQLACPVCFEMMGPPILQCANGHTICQTCNSNVSQCPICRHEIGKIRCLALEKIAECLEVPCKYQSLGCQHVSPYSSRLGHQVDCRFRPYNCPEGSECPVTGDIPHLVAHLQSDHKVAMIDGPTFTLISDPYSDRNAMWLPIIVLNCHGFQFCLHLVSFELGPSPVYMAFIRFMGHEEDSDKFHYTLEFGSDRGKLMWQEVPRSIRDSYAKVHDSMEGLLIHRNAALSFSKRYGNDVHLKIKGRISLNSNAIE